MNTIDAPLNVQARKSGDHPAVITPRRRISYRELYGRVRAKAGALSAAGIKRHDRVGIFMDNGFDLVIVLHALFHLEAAAAPLSTRTPAGQLPDLLERIDSELLITDREPVREHVTSAVHVDSLNTSGPASARGQTSFDLDTPATIVFTSGSSGRPKPVLHSFGNHYFSALGSNENISLAPDDRWLLSLPLYHVGGLAVLFRCFLAGAAVIIPDPDAHLSESIAEHRVTHVSLVSTQLRRLLADTPGPHELRAILLGGGRIPDALIDAATDRGLPIRVSYGLTEMTSQVTTTPPDAAREQLHSSGKLLPYRQLEIANDGEILVRGSTLFQGYVDGTSLDLHRDDDGWYHTSDIGRVDADGYLHVLGRKDNMFISGGENIYPEEIESVLERMPSIDEAAVVPVRHDEFGFRPAAFVRWKKRPRPLEELREEMTASLARFKLPIAIFEWPDSRASSGLKVDREHLRIVAEERLNL